MTPSMGPAKAPDSDSDDDGDVQTHGMAGGSVNNAEVQRLIRKVGLFFAFIYNSFITTPAYSHVTIVSLSCCYHPLSLPCLSIPVP